MRFSELADKELVDLREGIRLGELGHAELVFHSRTGRLHAIAVASRGSWWQRARELVIPWAGVRKIGTDLIMVDLGVADRRRETNEFEDSVYEDGYRRHDAPSHDVPQEDHFPDDLLHDYPRHGETYRRRDGSYPRGPRVWGHGSGSAGSVFFPSRR